MWDWLLDDALTHEDVTDDERANPGSTSAMVTALEHASDLLSLPDSLVEHIASSLLELRSALALCCTCRSVHRTTAATCTARLLVHNELVLHHFPLHVIRCVPMSVWLQVEWIPFDPKWHGSTGYVDRVETHDIPGGPFKCSRDEHGRLMLLMRRKADVAVLFQRYSDSDASWAFTSHTLPIGGGCRQPRAHPTPRSLTVHDTIQLHEVRMPDRVHAGKQS